MISFRRCVFFSLLFPSYGLYASLRGGDEARSLSQGGSYSKIPGYDCFRSIDGMTDTMFDLEKDYPNLVSIKCELKFNDKVAITKANLLLTHTSSSLTCSHLQLLESHI